MCGRLIPFISHLIIHALNDSMGSVFCVRFFFFLWQEENIEKINVKRLKKQRQTVKYISGLRRKNSKMGSFMFTWILTWTKKIMYNANRFTYYAHTHTRTLLYWSTFCRSWYLFCLSLICSLLGGYFYDRILCVHQPYVCHTEKDLKIRVCVCMQMLRLFCQGKAVFLALASHHLRLANAIASFEIAISL